MRRLPTTAERAGASTDSVRRRRTSQKSTQEAAAILSHTLNKLRGTSRRPGVVHARRLRRTARHSKEVRQHGTKAGSYRLLLDTRAVGEALSGRLFRCLAESVN